MEYSHGENDSLSAGQNILFLYAIIYIKVSQFLSSFQISFPFLPPPPNAYLPSKSESLLIFLNVPVVLSFGKGF
jgi:hypothetical protein